MKLSKDENYWLLGHSISAIKNAPDTNDTDTSEPVVPKPVSPDDSPL